MLLGNFFSPHFMLLVVKMLSLGAVFRPQSAKWNSCFLPLLLASPQPLILFQWPIFTFGNSYESEQLLFPPCCSCISCSCRRGQRKQGWGMEARSSLLGWLRGRVEGQRQLALLVRRWFLGEAWWWWLHSSVHVLGTVELYTEIWLQWWIFMYILPWLRKK